MSEEDEIRDLDQELPDVEDPDEIRAGPNGTVDLKSEWQEFQRRLGLLCPDCSAKGIEPEDFDCPTCGGRGWVEEDDPKRGT